MAVITAAVVTVLWVPASIVTFPVKKLCFLVHSVNHKLLEMNGKIRVSAFANKEINSIGLKAIALRY
jgi:hypothetical protein